ncbi:hypothetical protein ACFPOG_12365 [Paenibacillus aestuarii]|uniref:Immunity protein 43 domain-containing protein n=1 Tax=Paenibacillus aestuarii TaxID=516965 RepID=A0ABW0K726_9BACL
MKFLYEQFAGNQRVNMAESEINEILKSYDDFNTWGYMGVPNEDSPLNTFYLVPKTPIATPPVYMNIAESEIDYRLLAGVIANDTDSYFFCEYYYSYDEFKNTQHRGTFKIKICQENKKILDWIVKKRFLLLMSRSPKTYEMFNIEALISYFTKHPGITLEIKDIAGLAFHNDYLNLIDPNKRGA